MRRLDRARRTGCPRRYGYALQIEGNHHRFTVNVSKLDIRGVGYAHCAIAIYRRFLDLGENTLLQAIAHRRHFLVALAVQRFVRQLRGFAQPHNSRNIFRPGAKRTLVPASIK